MRVLFTSSPGYGHLQPMLPVARALRDAGDEVAIATVPELLPRAEAAGFTSVRAGDDFADWWPTLQRLYPSEPWTKLAPEEILQWFVPHLFGEVGAPAMLRDLMTIVGDRRPDVIIHESFEFAAPVAAAAAGIPSVHHTLSPLFGDDVLHLAAEAVAPLWRVHGLEPDAAAGLQRQLCLDICPPSLRNPGASPAAALQPLRPVAVDAVGDEPLPASLDGLPAQPTVHVTLGTASASADQNVLATIVAGLGGEPVNVVLTVGPDHDPAALGPQPANVIVERYLPHALLLPRCDLVVSHGGAGTMLAALSHGLPVLSVPQGADQYLNAHMCVRRGVGRTLLTEDLTPETARDEVRTLLDDSSYGTAARGVQTEIARMPAPADVVEIVRHL